MNGLGGELEVEKSNIYHSDILEHEADTFRGRPCQVVGSTWRLPSADSGGEQANRLMDDGGD